MSCTVGGRSFEAYQRWKALGSGTLDGVLWNGAGSRHYLLRLFQYRTMVACYKANRALRYGVEVEKLSIDGETAMQDYCIRLRLRM